MEIKKTSRGGLVLGWRSNLRKGVIVESNIVDFVIYFFKQFIGRMKVLQKGTKVGVSVCVKS